MTLTRRLFAAGAAMMGVWSATAARAAPKTWSVMLDEAATRFTPAALTVAVGDKVEWTNNAVIVHTVDFDPAATKTPANVALPPGVKPFGSGDMDQDKVFSHVFTVPGLYKYVCRYHEEMGMTGSVTVT